MTNKNKQQQSLFIPVLIVTAVMLSLLMVGWHLAEKSFENIVPVENVEIEGRFENLLLSDVREKVVAVLDGGYFTVDLVAIRHALLDLPWVEDASIRRQWPAGLFIRVIEKQPVAYWGSDSLLSSKGDLFNPETINTGWALPKLNGPQGQHVKVWSFMSDIAHDLAAMGLDVKQLVLDERRAWSMRLADKGVSETFEVRLGREDTDHRLARLVKVFSNNDALDLSGVEVIDMRYPNGFAIRSRNKDTETMLNRNEHVREV